MTKKAPSIVFAGGGTAGHINPMLAIARAVRDLEPNAKILMLGTADKMEAELVPAAGFDIEFIPRAAFLVALTVPLWLSPLSSLVACRRPAASSKKQMQTWLLAWAATCARRRICRR